MFLFLIEKKREVAHEDAEYLITDAAEQPVQRSKKGQKKHHREKEKAHTLKTQHVIAPDGKFALFSAHIRGRLMASIYIVT
ncbi:MAG: hypothetical protein R2941_25145 [Desulfobacterales bacterium]